MNFVDWSQWGDMGMIAHGQMPIRDVAANLQKFEQEAKRILKETDADHVVYGVKYYNADGNLDRVHFHLMAVTDERFDSIARLSDVVVYALHKH